jgi:hypothetical protein
MITALLVLHWQSLARLPFETVGCRALREGFASGTVIFDLLAFYFLFGLCKTIPRFR